MAKIAILGDGGWGTALAIELFKKGFNVSLWGVFKDYIKKIAKARENTKFLKGVTIPKDIDITVGVVGIGSFFRITKDKQKDYPSFISPNVGGIMRMVKPIMTKNVNDLIANFYTTGELHIIVNS